jgi:nucleotide-binding universal stress UspA family protein
MKILLGIDSSEHFDPTVSFLCGMPWPKGTSVVVFSAIGPAEPEFAPEPHLVASVAGEIAVLEADHVRTHEEWVARAERKLRDAGLETKGVVSYGDPRHLLVEAARAEAVDLVVVGTHDRTGLGRWFAGSVASYVVAHAPASVLVIRHPHA